jgi:hypothetical protein
LLIAFVLLPPELAIDLRLLLAALLGLLLAAVVYSLFRRAAGNAARPEKKAILSAVRLASFTWRATTFEFANEAFAERFADLNRSRLMEP